MQQIIYGDVLFIINFCMEYLALYITSCLLKIKYKRANVFVSALIGSLYSLISVAFLGDHVTWAILSAIVMCFIAYYGNSKKYLLYEIVVFFAVNFLLGGGMTAVFNIFNSFGNSKELLIYGEVSTIESNMPMKIFMLGFSFIGIVAVVFGRILTKESKSQKAFLQITVNDVTDSVLVREDSGNLLTETISGEPIIFLTERSMLKFFSPNDIDAIKNIELQKLNDKELKARLLVYETVSGKELCACIKPFKITNESKEIDAWLAMGKNMTFGGCDGIAPSAALG